MVIARNKKANFDYFILDKFECGIELVGTEVKSIREGKVSIKESYVKILKQELFILNMHICLLYTSPSPRDISGSRMPSSA